MCSYGIPYAIQTFFVHISTGITFHTNTLPIK